jgi:hypothetical protein
MKKPIEKTLEVQGKGAFEVHQHILDLKRTMGMAFLEMGKLLKQVRDEGYYTVLGYDSFASYVINSELGFKTRTAQYYIEIFEWYVDKLSYSQQYLAELGQDKLMRLLPIIKLEYGRLTFPDLKDRIEELVTEVKELRPVDFEKKYKDDSKQVGHEDYLAPPEYFRCDKCGKWKIVIPIKDCCPEFLAEIKKYLIDNEGQKL